VPSGKHINILSRDGGVGRPDDSLDVKSSEKHSGVCLLLEGCWLLTTEMSSSGNVGGSIEVLTTRVKKVDLISIESYSRIFLWLVMDHSSIWTD